MASDVVFSTLGWETENLRLSIFIPGRLSREGLWEEVVGSPPESKETRPRQNNIYQEHGEVDGNRLVFAVQDSRVDWTLTPGSSQSRPPQLTKVDSSISLLKNALDTSLQSIRQVDRLALGTTFVREASSLDDAMNFLSRFLHHIPSPKEEELSDFVYQINRRRRSIQAPHVKINRVAKWSVEMFQQIHIQVRSGISTGTGTGWVSKLVLDINTVPEGPATSASNYPTIFNEFIGLTHRVAQEGDV